MWRGRPRPRLLLWPVQIRPSHCDWLPEQLVLHDELPGAPSFPRSLREGGDFSRVPQVSRFSKPGIPLPPQSRDFADDSRLTIDYRPAILPHASRYFSYFDFFRRLLGKSFSDRIPCTTSTGNTYHTSSGAAYATSTSI